MTDKSYRDMKRRLFLKQLGLASTSYALGGIGSLYSAAGHAAHGVISVPKTLVNLMLYGGADLRYLIAPAPTADPVYISQYWNARRNLYDGSYATYADMFAGEYTLVVDPVGGVLTFGIHNSAGWLASEFNSGNVAIVANTYVSLNRRHDHSQLMVLTGDPMANRTDYDREGWGGRLVETLSGAPNVVELSHEVQIFCNGSDPGYRLAQVLHTKDTRDMGLAHPTPGGTSRDDAQMRALTAYYTARGIEIETEKPSDWLYRKFFQHHATIRAFGDLMTARMALHPRPTALDNANFSLNSGDFRSQCRNLYDVCLAPDILDYRVLSMSYGGWDTHTGQTTRIEGNLQDVFGMGGGLDTVMTQLGTDVPSAGANMVFTFPWDFGRQLAANGSNGTDHGKASYMVLVGGPVTGGIYGDLFPQREAIPDPQDSQGRTPFEISGRDINGLTSMEHVWARLCDWLQPSSGTTVFPGTLASPLETGVNLGPML